MPRSDGRRAFLGAWSEAEDGEAHTALDFHHTLGLFGDGTSEVDILLGLSILLLTHCRDSQRLCRRVVSGMLHRLLPLP